MTPAPSTFAIVLWTCVLVITVALLGLTYRQYAAQDEPSE
jgi:hypothetical protein